MEILNISLKDENYNIYIGPNSIVKLKEYIEKYDSILLLSNDKVGMLYKKNILSLIPLGKYFQLPDGEEYKDYNSIEKIYDFMEENNFYRNSLIISLGGGVICDIGGYVASSYMRGIDFIQIPTSLLAQVDASIGGKVAINHRNSKNLIGAFYQPKAVIIDTNFLKTLDKKEFISGMGEVIKHSLIKDNRDYFDFLNVNSDKILDLNEELLIKMIKYSCEIKKYIVEHDEKENGIRSILNFGHTYGHALESIYKFKNIPHGEGVAKGILFEIELGEYTNKNNETILTPLLKIKKEIINIFEKYKINPLPVYIKDNILINSMKKDKKNSTLGLTFISFKNFGQLASITLKEENIIKFNNIFCNKVNPKIKAVLDIGTNSVRVFISETIINEHSKNSIFKNKITKSLFKGIEITSLGQGVNSSNCLSSEAMERTVKAIIKFKEIALSYGATEIEAFATSAVRDATNREDFMTTVRNHDINIRCISGEIEATLSFTGLSEVFSEDKIAVLDIGGGSTEISIGENGSVEFLKSFNVGAVRATEKFFPTQDYSDENIQKCSQWLKEGFSSLYDISLLNFTLIGVAATVTTHVTIFEKMQIYNGEKINLFNLTKEIIENNLTLLKNKTLEERKNIIGLESKRAEFIIAGTLILLFIMKILNKDNIIVSEVDNLEGATILSLF
ncbi:MAG: 3-dehydroquinate synthase [Fusobacteriaceae bacterium]